MPYVCDLGYIQTGRANVKSTFSYEARPVSMVDGHVFQNQHVVFYTVKLTPTRPE